jgi:hypothetical protein
MPYMVDACLQHDMLSGWAVNLSRVSLCVDAAAKLQPIRRNGLTSRWLLAKKP